MDLSTINDTQPPYVITLLSDYGTPVSAFHKISQFEPQAFLFESTEGDSRLARYSIMGIEPVKTIAFAHGQATITDVLQHRSETETIQNPLDVLKSSLSDYRLHENRLPFPFTGGLVGYMGYGATRYFDQIPQQEADPFRVPEGFYGLYDGVIIFDHQYRRIHVISHRSEQHAQSLVDRLVSKPSLRPLEYADNISDAEIFENLSGPFTEATFAELVRKGQAFIQEGQIFQIVLSHRFSGHVTSQPLDIYRLLQAVNPSPYAYFLMFPEFVYLGSSPETFVKCEDQQVVLRALAGTRPRGKTEEEDEQLAAELRMNEKELAEHHMLVDLGRNDLGRVCQPGTISVGEIATLLKYTHVMHLATEITGKLAEGKSSFDVFQSCFPRGTVSGAPKIRAMQLLSELEPEQRGIYSGVVGYFDFNGNMDGAIAIRSALVKESMAHVNAGAGVVFDSDPVAEYQETCNKAKSILKAIKLAERSTACRL